MYPRFASNFSSSPSFITNKNQALLKHSSQPDFSTPYLIQQTICTYLSKDIEPFLFCFVLFFNQYNKWILRGTYMSLPITTWKCTTQNGSHLFTTLISTTQLSSLGQIWHPKLVLNFLITVWLCNLSDVILFFSPGCFFFFKRSLNALTYNKILNVSDKNALKVTFNPCY